MLDILYDFIQSSKFHKLKLEEFNQLFNQDVSSYLDEMVNQGELIFENHYYIKFDSSIYVKGKIRINPKGFGFIDYEDCSYYVDKNNTLNALDQDFVVGKKIQYLDSDEVEIIKILNHNISKVTGVIRLKKQPVFFCDNQKITKKIELLNPTDFKLVDGHKVVVEIVEYGKVLKGNITEILGHKDEVGVDILSILVNHDIDTKFSDAVLEEVNHINDIIEIGLRKDLRSLLTITIDGEDAKDLDDAISIVKENENTRLYVHIADVAYYVKENSEIDLCARERGTSVYVVDRVVPMLPQYLSNGICSLHANVDRYTLTVEILFDKHGEIVEYEIYSSVINSDYRTSYNEINELLNGNMAMYAKYEEIYPMCVDALNLSNQILNLRKKQGLIDFDTKEAKIIVNEKGKVKEIEIVKRNKVHRLIENFMISANECVAEFMTYQSLPALYRVHLAPEECKIREFIKFLKALGIKNKINTHNIHPLQLQSVLNQVKKLDSYPLISKVLLRSMQKAYYEENCLGHFGLSLDHYLHFTSPIRRYPDLVVHRSLHYFLFEQQFNKMDAYLLKLQNIGKQASIKERKAIDAEREVEDLKKCEYMKNKIGSVYTGIISGIQNFGIFVELDNTVEGLVRLKEISGNPKYNETLKQVSSKYKNYRIGDKVKVKIINVDILSKTIDFKLIEKGNANEKNRRSKQKGKA